MSVTAKPTNDVVIVHHHNDWLLVNKPAGISMQKEQESPDSLSLLQLALATLQKTEASVTRLWPVHRLDKATSGLVIFAKNAAAAAQFGQLFQEHLVEKHYLAIALGKPKKKQGWVKGDMEKGRNGSWLLMRSLNNPAISQFNSCAIDVESPVTKRLYLIKPKTGKTHQIRVALKSIGCPILGDVRYKGAVADRCYLHAWRLSFLWNEQRFSFQQAPLQGVWPDLERIELLNSI